MIQYLYILQMITTVKSTFIIAGSQIFFLVMRTLNIYS